MATTGAASKAGGGAAGKKAAKSNTSQESNERLLATDGRLPGRRGQATRRRLLDCTAELLGQTSYRDVKVIDIARKAGTSPATFYQYFPDVEHAVLVLAEETVEDAQRMTALARADWKGDRGYETARRLTEGFMDFWEGHRAIFRVVDLAAGEGDMRFRGLRTRALNPLTVAFADVIGSAPPAARASSGSEPMATAGVLVSMLAHVAAHRYGMEFFGIRTADLVDSISRIIFWTITGRKPPVD